MCPDVHKNSGYMNLEYQSTSYKTAIRQLLKWLSPFDLK